MESVKGTMCVGVLQALQEIIVKSEDVRRSVRLVHEFAGMEPANQTTRVFVNLDGLENCAIRTNLGLEWRREYIFYSSGINFF